MSQGTFRLDQKPVLAERKQSSLFSVSHGGDNQSRSAILGPNYQKCANHTRVYCLGKVELSVGRWYCMFPISFLLQFT